MGLKNIEDFYPLSPIQQGMLFHSLAAPNSGVYFEQFSCTLKGELNVAAFHHAWQQVINRHSILRTSFAWEGLKEPVQIVHRQVELAWEQKDWRHLSVNQQQEQIEAWLERDRACDFQLTRPGLMHLTLIQLADNYYYFTWSHHHLILDGWSVPLIFQEVFAFYQGFIQNSLPVLDTPRAYRDYIVWLHQQNLAEAETFWRQTLKGFTTPTKVWTNKLENQPQGDRYNRQEIALNPATNEALQSFVQQHQLTINTIVQGAWALLLSRYSNERDVVFGATISGRPPTLPKADSMIGLFINTLPVRVQIEGETRLLPWLKQIQAQQIEARQYEYSPLVKIQSWSEVPQNVPLFESIIVFENYPFEETSSAESDFNLDIRVAHNFDRTNYPLTLNVNAGEKFVLEIAYEEDDYFYPASIERMLKHLKILLEKIEIDSEQCLKELTFLSQEEQEQLLIEFNDNSKDFPIAQSIGDLFQEQVCQTPAKIAVIYQQQQLTYQQLNQQANQLAHFLLSLGVTSGEFVAIYQPRNLNFLIAILAILKVGGVYVPIDNTYPLSRIDYMLSDSQVRLLLTDSQHCQLLLDSEISSSNSHLSTLVCLDNLLEPSTTDKPFTLCDRQDFTNFPQDNLEIKITGIEPAYMMYTSGSTGQPKGAIIHHGGAINHIYGQFAALELTSDLAFLQTAPASSDISVWQFLAGLLIGGKTVIVDTETVCQPEQLFEVIQQAKITLVELVPVVLRSLEDYLATLSTESRLLPNLQWMMVTGEAVSVDLVNRWLSLYPQIPVVNAYGPTEAADDITQEIIEQPLPENRGNVSIGKPLANLNLYILDREMQLVPIGVPGEICVSGYGVGLGYWQQEEKTKASFVINPFDRVISNKLEVISNNLELETISLIPNHQSPITNHQSRLYKTGDLGRWLSDGSIEYLGRIDNQVKIRGFRLELGEIEVQLRQHPDISDCVVIVREDLGGKSLVAYCIPEADKQLAFRQLRAFLQSKLPIHMIPSAFVSLAEFPLTPSGKIDRQALPKPDRSYLESEPQSLSSHTEVTKMLAVIWAEVLNLKQVGIEDNFFELGGHSLLATRLISRVKQVFGTELPLRSLFNHPTVASLAECIETAFNPTRQQKIEPVPRTARLPLSFAQQRLWFLAQLEPDSPDYNLPTIVRLQGKLNIAALEQSINEIIRRHEILRTSFNDLDGEPVQVINTDFQLNLAVIKLQDLDENQQNIKIQQLIREASLKPFNLSKIPLFRLKLIRLTPEEHLLVFVLHHIIFDFWSEELLLQELSILYENAIAQKPFALPELPIQYADFAVWQRQHLQGEVLATHISYWQQQLGHNLPRLQFPTQLASGVVTSQQGAIYNFAIEQDLSQALETFSQRQGVTLFITLLTAFKTLLAIYTQQQDIMIGSPVANRNHLDLEPLIGFFVNTLLLRTDLSGNPSFSELLARVREVTLNSYAHQELPFEKVVEILQPNHHNRQNSLIQVWFTLENATNTDLQLTDLSFSEIEFELDIERYELRLDFSETTEGLQASFGYRTDLFSEKTISQLVKYLKIILRQITSNPKIELRALTAIINRAEQEQQLIKHKEITQTNSQKLKRIRRKAIRQ